MEKPELSVQPNTTEKQTHRQKNLWSPEGKGGEGYIRSGGLADISCHI